MIKNDPATIILLANDLPGLNVAKYLSNRGDKILRLYIHSEKYQKYSNEIIKASKIESKNVYYDWQLKDADHVKKLRGLKPDFIISVFWKWLLSNEVLKIPVKGNVNFHPAYLPIGRGWYPHVMSFINKTSPGVTLHQMDLGTDTGPIWAQKKVKIGDYDTSGDVYIKLQKEIVKLFKKNWPLIYKGKIKPKAQDERLAIAYKKNGLDEYDKIDLNKKITFEQAIDLLRARSFGNRGYAYYIKNGKKVYLNLKLGKNPDFQ